MRIGILLTGFDGGGAQRRLLTLAREFLQRGHEVVLVAGQEGGPFRTHAPAGARVVSLRGPLHAIPGLSRRKSLRMLAAVPALGRYLRAGHVDVLLCGSTPANLAALAARDMARAAVPVVISVNVPLSRSTSAGRRPGSSRLVRRFYPRADAVVANAAFLADDVVRFVPVPGTRVTTIANPIDFEDIRSGVVDAAPHPWATDAAVPLVLAVGKLKAQKDFATLVRAFRLVRDVRPARLLVLGAGEHRRALLRLAGSLGLGEDAAFPGFVANPFPSMARAGVFVSSSLWEGFSNVIAEALACGCPVVATDCPGGVAEILDGGRFGKLVGVGDCQAMARAVLDTLEDPPDRESLQGRAAQYSVANAAEAYLGVLRACLPAAGGSP